MIAARRILGIQRIVKASSDPYVDNQKCRVRNNLFMRLLSRRYNSQLTTSLRSSHRYHQHQSRSSGARLLSSPLDPNLPRHQLALVNLKHSGYIQPLVHTPPDRSPITSRVRQLSENRGSILPVTKAPQHHPAGDPPNPA